MDALRVEGLDDVLRLLDDLKNQFAGEVLGGALRTALRPVRDKARAHCPVSHPDTDKGPQGGGLEPGTLKKSQAVGISPKRGAYRNGVVVGMVGAERKVWRRQAGVRTRGRKKGLPWFQDPAKYDHLVEKGPRKKPYLRPAWDAQKVQAANDFKAAILARLVKWAQKGKVTLKLRGQ